MKVDFTSDKFTFISKQNQYYLAGHPVECEDSFHSWKPDDKIEDGWGMFNGLTMIGHKGYTSSFNEFFIYYNGILINNMTYRELQELIIADERDDKISSIINL